MTTYPDSYNQVYRFTFLTNSLSADYFYVNYFCVFLEYNS